MSEKEMKDFSNSESEGMGVLGALQRATSILHKEMANNHASMQKNTSWQLSLQWPIRATMMTLNCLHPRPQSRTATPLTHLMCKALNELDNTHQSESQAVISFAMLPQSVEEHPAQDTKLSRRLGRTRLSFLAQFG